ncbi:hypothetical protein M5K25_015294 [Dendrobium thyrsiflorum]|uniref:Uncharacterized protein n=1 Tax=Dendrobium thyrsiflorum TaxID=117978 RepID=A0ABD0UQ70_DENTH
MDLKLANGTVLISGVETMHMVGKKMAFLVMVKYATSLSRESIVNIEVEATERLEALYPTLKELALAGSLGSHYPPLPEF